MKRLATISCRLGGSDCYCAFSFSRPLTDVGHDYFKEPQSLLAPREGEECMKDTNHHLRHPHGHLGARTSAQGTRGCAWPGDQFGRGQNPVLGWSDPTFAHGSVAKVTRGSLQPNKNFFGARGENLDEAGEEGRNYVLQLRLHHLLLLVNLISLGKTRKSETRGREK
jgi:hypothetical protein